MKVVAIIPARGGSKGIPHKNIIRFCGKPLLAWSILQARKSRFIDSVWVTSDDSKILFVASKYGARIIRRPLNISTDTSSSEAAWLHALEKIESELGQVDLVVGMQATSPIREPADLDAAIQKLRRDKLDSLLSCCRIEDYFIWEKNSHRQPRPVNYDYRRRKRRQKIKPRFLENGSFYLFKPAILRATHNRLGGKLGLYEMEKHKMFQIDRLADLKLCEAVMKGYRLDRFSS